MVHRLVVFLDRFLKRCVAAISLRAFALFTHLGIDRLRPEFRVIVAESEQGCGILGVIDGHRPKGVETGADVAHRKEFLWKIGYKL